MVEENNGAKLYHNKLIVSDLCIKRNCFYNDCVTFTE